MFQINMLTIRSLRASFWHHYGVNLVCCRKLGVSKCFFQKRKWSKDEISSLVAWKYETTVVCGPCIDAKNTISNVKWKTAETSTTSADQHCMDNVQAVVEIVDKGDETLFAHFPYSVSRRVLRQTVSEDAAENPMLSLLIYSSNSCKGIPTVSDKGQTVVSKSNVLDRQSSEDVACTSTKRYGTFGYTWVDSHIPKSATKVNAVPSAHQNIGSKTVDPVTPQVNISVTDPSSNAYVVSKTNGEQRLNSASSALKLQTNEVCTRVDSSDQYRYILSFPLFADHKSSNEAASSSARFPSVSAILKATMPPESQLALSRWEKQMIAALGEDGFKEYKNGLY